MAAKRRVGPRLLAAILLLVAGSWHLAAQTVTVSGHAKLPSNAAPAKTTVHYQLVGCLNGQARIDGVSLLSDYSQDYPVSAVDGSFSGLLFPNVGSPANTGVDCNGTYGSTAYNITVYANGRPNGKTMCYVVGPGNFNLDSAQPCVTDPAIVTPNAVVTNAQGTQTINQPDAGHPLIVNFLQAGNCIGCSGVSARTISGTVNGVNAVFTLPGSPPTAGLMFYFNGLMQAPGIDYTLAGNTLTMTIAPPMNSVLFAIY